MLNNNNLESELAKKELIEHRHKVENSYKLSLAYNRLLNNEDFKLVINNNLLDSKLKELVKELSYTSTTKERYDIIVNTLNGISTLQNYLDSITIDEEVYFQELTTIDESINGLINNKGNNNVY